MHAIPSARPHHDPDENRAENDMDSSGMPGFMTRQPLLDADFRVIGHELEIDVMRPLPVLPGAVSVRGNQDELLLASVIDMDYQQALGRKLTLLNLDVDSLVGPLVERLPRESAILAIRPATPTPELLARGQALTRAGFALALDEVALSPGMAPLARECRYLRLDVGDNDLMGLCDRLTRLQGLRGPRLIARNVETEEAFNACRKLSFDLYQGYFFARARPATGRAMDASRLRIMKLLNLSARHAEFPEIESHLKQDAALTVRLLRFINSPAVGLRYPVRSIGHALLMLGHDQLYRWLTLLLFVHESAGQGRNLALLRNALIRARFTENLGAARMPPDLRDGLFIVGILSMLDALLGLPMSQAVEGLNLAEPIVEALLRGEGPYAGWLALAVACERRDPGAIGRLGASLGVDAQAVNLAHIEALIWAEGMDL